MPLLDEEDRKKLPAGVQEYIQHLEANNDILRARVKEAHSADLPLVTKEFYRLIDYLEESIVQVRIVMIESKRYAADDDLREAQKHVERARSFGTPQ